MNSTETEKKIMDSSPQRTVDLVKVRPAPQTAVIKFKETFQKFTLRFIELKDRLPSLNFIRERYPAVDYNRVFVFISSMSVRYKIAVTLVMVLALAIASLGGVTFSRQKKLLEDEMQKRGEVLVQELANVGKEGLLTKEELGTFSTIKDIQKNSGVVYAMVVDNQGKVYVHNMLSEKGKILDSPLDQNSFKSDRLLFQKSVYQGEPILDASLPIVSKMKNMRIGTARIGLSEKELRDSIQKQKIIFSLISLGFVAIGLLISFGLSRVLTQPIYTLAVGMHEVAQGNLSQQVRVFYKDEIGKLTEVFNQMILSLREKMHMEKYLSMSTLVSIKKTRDHSSLRLGGEKKYVTALFSDVRGFTSMSEKMTPEEVVEILNIYLNVQGKVVLQRGGAVDKFVGDEVMAIFEGKDQEINAVRAAVEIQCFCKALNSSRMRLDKKQMQVGVGLNNGDVVMGNMGSEEQMNYTVIGDTINLAARLCSTARAGQVVISKAIADVIGKEAKLRKLEPVMVKGKDKPIEIYEVIEVSGVSRKYMRRLVEVNALYHLIGLTDELNNALVKNIGPTGCLLEASSAIGIGSRLEVEIDIKVLQTNFKVQGVVRHLRKKDAKYFVGIHFDELLEKDKDHITEWVHRLETETPQRSPA